MNDNTTKSILDKADQMFMNDDLEGLAKLYQSIPATMENTYIRGFINERMETLDIRNKEGRYQA